MFSPPNGEAVRVVEFLYRMSRQQRSFVQVSGQADWAPSAATTDTHATITEHQ
jgi:hypothetical protein